MFVMQTPGRWQEQVEWEAAILRIAALPEPAPIPDPVGLTFKLSKLDKVFECDVYEDFDIAALTVAVAAVQADTSDPLLVVAQWFSDYGGATPSDALGEALAEFVECLKEPWLYTIAELPMGVVRYRFTEPRVDPDGQALTLLCAAATLLAHPKLASAAGAFNIEAS